MTMYEDWGMCRISSQKQSIERQRRNIREAYPTATLVEETYTGTRLEGREQWNRLFDTVLKNQAKGKPQRIIFDSVSRMSRNAETGVEQYKILYNAGVELVFLNEPHVNTAVYREVANKQIQLLSNTGDAAMDTLINTIVKAINEYVLALAEKQIVIAFQQAAKEVEDLHIRTVQGLKTARLEGRVGGRRAGTHPKSKKEAPAKEAIFKYNKAFGGQLNDIETMKMVPEISKPTFYKYKKELMEEHMVEG